MSRTSNRPFEHAENHTEEDIQKNTSVATQRTRPITRQRRARPRPSTRTLASSCYPRCLRRRWTGCRAWTHVAPCWPWRTSPFRTTRHSRRRTWCGDGFSIPWSASEAWSPPCEWRWTEHPSTSTCQWRERVRLHDMFASGSQTRSQRYTCN